MTFPWEIALGIKRFWKTTLMSNKNCWEINLSKIIQKALVFDLSTSVGFSVQSIAWFESYLSNRKFQGNIKSKYSNVANINCGVPQRSILGPLSFLLYVNDMFQAVDGDLFIYADDQHRDVKVIEQNLKKVINKSNTQSGV